LNQGTEPAGPGRRALAVLGAFGGFALGRLGQDLVDLRQCAVRLLRRVPSQLGAIPLNVPSATMPSAASSRSTWLNSPPSASGCRARNRAMVA